MARTGTQHPNLRDTEKRTCSNCYGTFFQVEKVTGNAGAGEGIYFLCHCGHAELITFDEMGATLNYSE